MVLNCCFRRCYRSINTAWFLQPHIVFVWLLGFTILVELLGFLLMTFFPVLQTIAFGIIAIASVIFRMAIFIVAIPRPIRAETAEYYDNSKWLEAWIFVSCVVIRMGFGKVPDSMMGFVMLPMVTNAAITHLSMVMMVNTMHDIVSRSMRNFVKIASGIIVIGVMYPIGIYYLAMSKNSKTLMEWYIPPLYWYLIYLAFTSIRILVCSISWGVFVIPPEVREFEMIEEVAVVVCDGQVNVASAPKAAESSAGGGIPQLDSLTNPLLSDDGLSQSTSQAAAV